jgi:spore photoproduct lyase
MGANRDETMGQIGEYERKLAGMEGETLLPLLPQQVQSFVRELAVRYRFSFQELRMVSQAGRDLEMWREAGLPELWRESEEIVSGNGRERKKALLRQLERRLSGLAAGRKVYPSAPLAGPPRRSVKLAETATERTIFGRCAAYSDKTVCCGLHTIDAVMGCPFTCSYCTIQTFYGDVAELQADLPARLREIELQPDRLYHIGTGQASDSLVWGDRGGMLEALIQFAAENPNVLLELKTKSDNVDALLARDVPRNVVCSWSLNTQTIIDNEEHGTASLRKRVRAARSLAERGIPVGFHFHPMVWYEGWRKEYGEVAAGLISEIHPAQVAFVSMGSMTLIRPVVQQIRRRGGETKVLQMDMVTDPHGKLTYPEERKIEMFRHLYGSFRPWHEVVFFYLCMETAPVWEAVLGRSYATNLLFEQDFARRCLPALT